MKLRLATVYKSIKNSDKETIESIDFPSFSLITGTNGSGKTHFLDALSRSSVVEMRDNGDNSFRFSTVQFNYSTFNFKATGSRDNRFTEDPFAGLKNWKDKTLDLLIRKDNLLDALSNFLVNYMNAGSDEKTNLAKKFFRDRLLPNEKISIEGLTKTMESKEQERESLIEEPTMSVESVMQQCHFLLKDKSPEQISNLMKEPAFSQTNMGQTLIDVTKNYFLKKARHTYSRVAHARDRNEEKVSFKELDNQFIQANDNPLTELNKILRKIGCNDYVFEEKFPLNEREILDLFYRGGYLTSDGSTAENFFTYEYKPKLSDKKVTIEIDDLSSGEQILLGLAAFVYDQKLKKAKNFVLLLDEVDTNLHPSMVKKLLNLIQNVFIKEYKLKVFLVTHSPTTVALAPENSVFVMHRPGENKPRMEQVSNEKALKILSEGFVSITKNRSDLGISYNISKTELPVLFVEGITDKIILETAWKKLFSIEPEFFIQDCFSANFIKGMLANNDDIFEKYKERKFMALFDFDQEGCNQWNYLKKNRFTNEIESNISNCLTIKHEEQDKYAILLPVPDMPIKTQVIDSGGVPFKNPKLSIELLFYKMSGVDENYFEEVEWPGGRIVKFKGDKVNFASTIDRFSEKSFENFRPLFEQIKKILSS